MTTYTPIPIKFTLRIIVPVAAYSIARASMIATVNSTTDDLTSAFVKGLSFLNVVCMIYLFNGYIILEVDAKCLRYKNSKMTISVATYVENK